MRTLKVFVAILLISGIWINTFATVRTLNNNNPSPGQYTTWSDVHAACNAGDTVYVMGNNIVSYGYATITKNNLTIVGNGYFPSGPNNDFPFFNGITTQAPFITIDGIRSTSITYDYDVAAGVLVMRHCLIDYLDVKPTNFPPELRLRYNVIGDGPNAMRVRFAASSNTYLSGEFYNNIFNGNIIFDNYGFSGCFMQNNIFKAAGNALLIQGTYDVGIFASNIIINYGSFAYSPSSLNCVNNCIYATNNPTFTSLPNDNNSTIVGNPLFVNICTPCAYPYGGDYHLQSGSPCIGTGFFGTDMGVYGGIPGAYFAQRGEPFIPHIKQFTVPASGFYGAAFTANIVSWVKTDASTNLNIIKGEYFWNTDPGVGNGYAFNVSAPSDSVTFTTTIQTTGANLFDNYLYIRTRDNAGHWSLSEVQPYFINKSITTTEYFWDNDPGFGNGTALNSFSPSDSINFNQSISTSGIKKGNHIFYTRTKNSDGIWSLTEGRFIYVQPQIKSAEYFWDNDPGTGHGTAISSFNATDSLNINRNISTAGIKKGYHFFYTRTKDSDGTWSLSEGRIIYVQPQILSAEYFWDTDPGAGNGTTLSSLTSTDSLNINRNISTAGIKKGYHFFYTRTKDSDGAWSLSEGRIIYVQPQIKSAEYFWDNDPGVGNGTALSSITTSDSININPSISSSNISNGYHVLYTRTKDSDGSWSIAEGRNIYVKPWIEQGEYFWDTDPGFGNGTTFYSDNGSLKKDSVNNSFSVSAAGLSRTWHYLYTRYQDNDNHWSLSEVRSIKVINVIKAAEYFFDNDPGFGQATAIPVNPLDTIFNFSGNITLPPLAAGLHKMYIRTQDWDNKWSHTDERSFNIYLNTLPPTSITNAEFYFDTDPGLGNGTNFANVSQGATVNYNDSIVLPQLAGGLHTMFMRTKDNNNKWSLTEQKNIYINSISGLASTITAASYFIDNDAGVANDYPISITSGSTVNFNSTISLPSMSSGAHTFNLRTRDNNGKWSLFEQKLFFANTTNATQISNASYFIDTDAGVANDYPISITNGATVNFNSAISLPSISSGVHTFNLRTRDNNGTWSIYEPKLFFATTANATQITNAEFFIDNDPGVGNATNLSITTPASTVDQCSYFTLPSLATGAHKLFLRTKDNRGIWALQEPRSLTGVATSSVSITPGSPVNICAGASVTLTATTTGGPWTQQWYNGCTLINGANSLSLTVNTLGTYTIVVTSGSTIQTATVVVNVISLPNLFVVTGGGNYCSNQVGGLNIQLTGSQLGVNYQLFLNGTTAIGSPVAGTGNAITFSNQTLAGNYTVRATTVLGGCTSTMTNSATITVEQAITWYQDADADDYGNISVSQQACVQPLGYVSDSTDCNDTPIIGVTIHPFATEICDNAIDDNCNGQTDEGCISTINIKLFIEGLYVGNGLMQPVMFNAGVSANDTLCDSVIVELHDQFNPSMLVASDTIVIDINGNGSVIFHSPFHGSPIQGVTGYIAVRSRNAIETWSKLPITLGANTSFDFTAP